MPPQHASLINKAQKTAKTSAFLRSKARAVSLDAPRCIGSRSTQHREKPPAASSQAAFCVGNHCQAFSHSHQPAFIVASSCMLRCQRNPRPPLPAFFPSPVLYVALSTQPPPSCYLPSQSLRAMSFRARHWPRRMVSCSLWCSHGARMRSCPLAQALISNFSGQFVSVFISTGL